MPISLSIKIFKSNGIKYHQLFKIKDELSATKKQKQNTVCVKLVRQYFRRM